MSKPISFVAGKTLPLKNIIYIDDDLDDIVVFQEAMQVINPSYLLQIFSDAPAAVEFLEASIIKPDIIFLDINMPGLSGAQTLLLIRRIQGFADVPVIMYSTTIREEDSKLFLDLGANGFLIKPMSFEAVVKEIRQVLTRFIISD